MVPPKLAVLTPALTPEQNFRCREVGDNGVISYVERDHGSWAVKGSNLDLGIKRLLIRVSDCAGWCRCVGLEPPLGRASAV